MNTDTPPAIVELAAGKAEGIASWYGEEHRGRKMANGKPFDPDAMTCATWHHPFGTRLSVTSKLTGRSVEVVVTDRGPGRGFNKRIIDLSKAAFAKIRSPEVGLDSVVVEVIK